MLCRLLADGEDICLDDFDTAIESNKIGKASRILLSIAKEIQEKQLRKLADQIDLEDTPSPEEPHKKDANALRDLNVSGSFPGTRRWYVKNKLDFFRSFVICQ